MNYPIEILPAPDRKWIDCPLNDHFLIRHVQVKEGDVITDSDTENIKVGYICTPKEHINDLSTSLLGIYKPEHINLNFTADGKIKYMHYCEPDEPVDPPVFKADFDNNANRSFWCAPIARLHQQAFDYSRDNKTFIAICVVMHTPARWNFWHFSLRWRIEPGMLEDMEKKEREKIAQKIGHSARTLISHFARAAEPEHPTLPQSCYCKN
jgi:hypothetical protein